MKLCIFRARGALVALIAAHAITLASTLTAPLAEAQDAGTAAPEEGTSAEDAETPTPDAHEPEPGAEPEGSEPDGAADADSSLPAVPPPPEAEPTDAYAPEAPTDSGAELGSPTGPSPAAVPPPPPAAYGRAEAEAPVPATSPQAPATAADPDRRAGSEMIELYITGGIFGFGLGLWGAAAAEEDLSRDEDNPVVFLPWLGAGVGTMTVFALDQLGPAFRTGIPASISMGGLLGASAGLVSLGAFDLPTARSRLGLLVGLSALGLTGGTLVGHLMRPTAGDARLVGSTGVWGAYFGALAAAVAEVPIEDGFRVSLAGLGAGTVVGLLLAPANDLPSSRVLLLSAGVGAGAFAGLSAYAVLLGDRPADSTVEAAISMGAGSIAGLIGAYLFVRHVLAPLPEDDGAVGNDTHATWAPWVSPTMTEGTVSGGTIGVSGDL